MSNAGPRRNVAAWLEDGKFQGAIARLLARYWERHSRPVRPVTLPEGASVIGIAGSTLGGGGKTPVVKALARELHARGHQVAVVASSYRARPPSAVRVLRHHHVDRVGDEALELCRSLPDVPVYVGQSREKVLRLAARTAKIVLVDSLLQTAPARLALSVLVVDGERPWGAGACPPMGDLRARRDRLLRATDVLLVEGSLAALEDVALPPWRWTFRRTPVGVELPDGQLLPLSALAGKRLGLLTTVARPARVREKLRAHGICVDEWRAGADHARIKERRTHGKPPRVDVWLSTAKCRERVGQLFENIPVWVIVERVDLPAELLDLVSEKGVIRSPGPVLESAPCFPDR